MKTPNNPLRALLERVAVPRFRRRGSVPVNKATGGALQRRLPQLDNPVLLGAAAVGALGAGLAATQLRSAGRGGRPERFRALLAEALAEVGYAVGEGAGGHPVVTDIDVQVLEGFGKLPLVSADVTVDASSPLWSPVVGEQLIDALAKAAWNNPEIAPVAVRARMISADEGDEVMEMSAAGFTCETARPEELVERFGPPAFDPLWKG